MRILLTLITMGVISVVIVQSCTTDDLQKPKENQVSDLAQQFEFGNLSTLSREEYSSFSSDKKVAFKKAYTNAFRNGGGCSCSSSDGGGCTVNCPSGTKPKCQKLPNNGCDCGCEPYGDSGIKRLYEIQRNKDNSVTLIKKNSDKSLRNFSKSNLPNASKVNDLFAHEPEFTKEEKGIINLTEREFYVLESKFQNLMGNYTIEQYFEVEYGF